MGAPSGCSVSEPETLLAAPSGGLISAVPLASQPPPEGAISNSSWPTVCPPSLMVNLPLSCAKSTGLDVAAGFFCAARENTVPARMARAKASDTVLNFTMLLTPGPFSLRTGVSQPPDEPCFPRRQQCHGAESR